MLTKSNSSLSAYPSDQHRSSMGAVYMESQNCCSKASATCAMRASVPVGGGNGGGDGDGDSGGGDGGGFGGGGGG